MKNITIRALVCKVKGKQKNLYSFPVPYTSQKPGAVFPGKNNATARQVLFN